MPAYDPTPSTAEGLAKVLMHSQSMTLAEARELVAEMRQEVAEGSNPEELLHDVGLEPDYVFCLI